MGDQPRKAKSSFERVGECLYRYSSNGVYYALLKIGGKQKRSSLGTTDRALAKRKLNDMRGRSAAQAFSEKPLSVADLCQKYLLTVVHQKPATVRRKKDIVDRLLKDLPGGSKVRITAVRRSAIEAWLSSYPFGPASYNLHLECARAVFQMAVDDRMLTESPVAGIKSLRRPKPVRSTPSFEEFQKIIADVRDQIYNADVKDSGDFLEFMGLAGLGQAELGGLRREHFNFEQDTIAVFRVKTSSFFQIPLYPQLRGLVARMKIKAMPYDQKIFPVKDAKNALTGACRRLGLPSFSQRSFRRMFVTRCIELGIDVKVIADWQGHQDGCRLILATYSHVRKDHAEEMARRLTLSR